MPMAMMWMPTGAREWGSKGEEDLWENGRAKRRHAKKSRIW